MEIQFRLQRTSLVWLACAIISCIVSVYLGYRFISIQNNFLFQAKDDARKETKSAARELNAFISVLKPIAQEIADEISNKDLSKKEIEALLKKKKPVTLSGLGVAFLPYAIDSDTKLFAPFYFESEGVQKLEYVEKVYDYTSADWFNVPIKEGAQFVEPYYGATIKTIVAEYVVPIYHTDAKGNKKAIGVVYANQSVEHLNHILETLFLNQKSYWALLTKGGKFIAHPQEQLIHKQVTIFDLAKQLDNPDLGEIAKQIIEKKPVFFEYENEITGAPSWLFSEPLEGTNWSILGIFDKNELNVDANILRHNLIYPSLGTVLFMIFLTLFIFSLFAGDHLTRWWIASGIVSLALIGQIIWVWHATYRYPVPHKKTLYSVNNKADLYDYLKKETTPVRYGRTIENKQAKSIKQATPTQSSLMEQKKDALLYGYKNARYIPTGIFVNSLQLTSSNQIAFSGYIWQRFTDGLHDDIPRGFTLPQSTTETKKIEVSNIREGDSQTILWEVHATLDQLLFFDRYPFDTKSLQIQIWHRYTKNNVVLVPDLDGYQLINPRSLPGIDDDTYIPGWNIVATNFGYKKVNYTSNFGSYAVGPFGIYESVDKSEVPELFFNVLVTRRLIDTLISDLLPIAVIAVLLFVILLTSTQQKLGVIGSCATVFFATIFAQLRFRSKIPQAQVVYFESFFFLMYAMILVILLVTILHQMKFNIPLIRHRDNIIAKLLYWPLLFATLAIITLGYLY